MEEKEQELFKEAWRFLVKETAARRGFEAKNIVIGEVPGREQHPKKQETA